MDDEKRPNVEPARIGELVDALTLDEKASLTAGVGLWYLPAVERLGIPALKVSDGPSGVRGDSMIGRRRSLSMPCGMTIGSTWNPELVHTLGETLAAEAASKNVHVLLGPTVCIVRTPLAGRTFESYSEDPYLTSRLAVAYVRGVQTNGVACCIKHYACNDQEHERMTISAEVDERTLREIHLPAFEAAVREAGVWSLMTAYNRLNGTYCCEQPHTLGEILRGEWGFDGLVMSDWFGTHSTVPAARAGLDLEMPGPSAYFDGTLADAVRRDELDESVVDGQVRNVLRLMDRVGILEGDPGAGADEREDDIEARRAVARTVANEGTVLLRNEGLLPLDPAALAAGAVGAGTRRVAVIGPNAGVLEIGGGSSEVTPHRRRTVGEALADVLPGVAIVPARGCRTDRVLPTIDMRQLADQAFAVTYYDTADLGPDAPAPPPAGTDVAHNGRLSWVGAPVGLTTGEFSVRLRATFTPEVGGPWTLGLESAGRSVWRIDGEVAVDNSNPARGEGFYGAGSSLVEVTHTLEAGRAYAVEVDLWPRSSSSAVLGVRLAASPQPQGDELEEAVALARQADVAVVVVGSNRFWESEGFDRPDLSLPGDQDRLVEAVCAANPRTVVVVNAGSPVDMPWADSTGAILLPWYPGEEGAASLADIVTGRSEPSGRLPVTWPMRLEDTPAHAHYPGSAGRVEYAEGVFVGYRHYVTRGIEPRYCFGHGLSYTSFSYGPLVLEGRVARVEVTNDGPRPGTEVVQFYVHASGSRVERPDRELARFAKVRLEPGRSSTVEVELGDDAFAYWCVDSGAWRTDRGTYDVLVGSSSGNIRSRATLVL